MPKTNSKPLKTGNNAPSMEITTDPVANKLKDKKTTPPKKGNKAHLPTNPSETTSASGTTSASPAAEIKKKGTKTTDKSKTSDKQQAPNKESSKKTKSDKNKKISSNCVGQVTNDENNISGKKRQNPNSDESTSLKKANRPSAKNQTEPTGKTETKAQAKATKTATVNKKSNSDKDKKKTTSSMGKSAKSASQTVVKSSKSKSGSKKTAKTLNAVENNKFVPRDDDGKPLGPFLLGADGRPYRSFRLVEVNFQPTTTHNAKQRARKKLEEYPADKRNIVLCPRNAASKILTSWSNRNKDIDVINKLHIITIEEITRSMNRQRFSYLVSRSIKTEADTPNKSGLRHSVKSTTEDGKMVETEITTMYKNNLKALNQERLKEHKAAFDSQGPNFQVIDNVPRRMKINEQSADIKA